MGKPDLSGLEGQQTPTATCQASGTTQLRGAPSHPKLAELFLVMTAAAPKALPASLEVGGEKKGKGRPQGHREYEGLCLQLPGPPLWGLLQSRVSMASGQVSG